MSRYYDLPWPQRMDIRNACEAAGSAFDHGLTDGFRVAVGRGRLSQTIAALEPFGVRLGEVYTFPLGTATPPEHLRHDYQGMPSCCWLMANFEFTTEEVQL
jgi:hypothetical protein